MVSVPVRYAYAHHVLVLGMACIIGGHAAMTALRYTTGTVCAVEYSKI